MSQRFMFQRRELRDLDLKLWLVVVVSVKTCSAVYSEVISTFQSRFSYVTRTIVSKSRKSINQLPVAPNHVPRVLLRHGGCSETGSKLSLEPRRIPQALPA